MFHRLLLIGLVFSNSFHLEARNLSDPIYLEPFDRGAGGTVLTRASREGVLLGNPALLGLGSAWLRWVGMQTTIKLAADKDKVQTVIDAINSGTGSDTNSESAIDTNLLSNVDLGPGAELSVSFLNKHAGGALIGDAGLYAKYDEFGDTGIPGARLVVDAVGGMAASAAFSPVRWLHLGATQKYLYGIEKNVVLTPVNGNEGLAEAQDISGLGEGQGTDIGMLLFFQDFTIDYLIGLTVKNLTPVKFSNEAYPTLPQTKNLGLGLTFHSGSNAVHFSAELHDIESKTGESLSRRLRFGSRLTLWQRLGLAVGIYNDKPSYGLKLDLLFLKIGLSFYSRIVGFGNNSFSRDEGTITFSVGF